MTAITAAQPRQRRLRIILALLARVIGATLVYIGTPVLVVRILPRSVGGVTELVPWIVRHAHAVLVALKANNGQVVDEAIRVILASTMLIAWIYLVMAAAVSGIWYLLYRTKHIRSPREVRWLRASAILVFSIAQLIGALHMSGTVQRQLLTAGNARPTTVTQQVQLTSATIAGTRVTIPVDGDLWQVAAQQLGPSATPTQIASLVDQIAQLNGIANPNLVYPGQEVIVPQVGAPSVTLDAPTPAAPSVELQAPVTPPPSVTLDAPTPAAPSVELQAPTAKQTSAPSINLDATTLARQSMAAHHRDAAAAEEAAAFALLAGAFAVGAARSVRRKRMLRPLGMRLALADLHESHRAYLATTEEASSVYRAAEQTLTLLLAVGAPLLRWIAIDDDGVATIALAEPMTLPEPFEALGNDTMNYRVDTRRGVAQAVDVVNLALAYGHVTYLGVNVSNGQQRHVLAPIDHVVRLRGMSPDMWRALIIEHAWISWRSFQAVVVRGMESLGIENELATRVDAVVVDDDDTLVFLVADEMRQYAERVGNEGTSARPSDVRLRWQAPALTVVALEPMQPSAYTEMRRLIGTTRAVGMLVTDEGLPEDDTPVWVYDRESDLLIIDDPVIGHLEVVPPRMSETHALVQAAWLEATTNAGFVPYSSNDVVELLRNRRGTGSGFMVKLCYPSPVVCAPDGSVLKLSPLAVRLATVLACAMQPVTLDYLALAVGIPSLSDPVFWRAYDEVQSAVGDAWVLGEGDTVAFDATVALDLAQILDENGKLLLGKLRELVEQGTILGVEAGRWTPWGRTTADVLRSAVVDLVVTATLGTWRRSGDTALLTSVRTMLEYWYGVDSATALLEVAEVASREGRDAALRVVRDRFVDETDGADVPPELVSQIEMVLKDAAAMAAK